MSHNARRQQIADLCAEGMKKIDEALAGTRATTLSGTELLNIRDELAQMQATLDPGVYSPSYSRFITDSYTGGDPLTDFLLEISYQYQQRLK
jgi:hypothetical protein